MSTPTALLPLADALFTAMGIDEPMPRIDIVPRPRLIDLNALTAQEREWVREGEIEGEQS